MNKRCIIDKILNCGIVLSLILLYWSSDLLEKDVKSIKRDVRDVREDIQEVLGMIRQSRAEISSTKLSIVSAPAHSIEVGDPRYPNLLSPDLYKEKTLGSLLGENFVPKGILRTAHIGKPNNLSPFNGYDYVRKMYDLCVPGLASSHVGKYEQFAPGLALKVEEHPVLDGSGDKEFHVYLRPNVFWASIDPTRFPKQVQLSETFLQPHPV